MGLTKPRASQIFDIDYKQATRVITVSNVTLTGGAPSVVDGVSLTAGDRVLVTGQSTGSENGLYAVAVVGIGSDGTWVRTNDGNEDGEIQAGMIVMVTEGATYADTQWKLTTDGTIDIGTTALVFAPNTNESYGNVEVAAYLDGSAGNIIPIGNNTQTLGSATFQWKDVYVGPGSLYVNNQKVLEDNSGTITLTADVDQNLSILTHGNGDIEINPGGLIQLKGNVEVSAGYYISQAGGGSIQFSSGISTNTITSLTADTNLTLSALGTGYVYANDNLVVAGNLTVNGDATNLSVTSLTVQDNIITIAAEQTGTPTVDAGISVERGDLNNTLLRWTEGSLKWQFTNDGSTYQNIIGTGTNEGSISATGNIDSGNINATGNITGGNLITAGSITLNQLSLNSDLTTVSPLQLTAGSLQDGVGALRIDAVEPDIYLNDTNSSGHSTVTFATGNVAAAAIGKNNNEDFYITVNTSSGWLDTTFIADHLTGNISLGYNLAVTGNINSGNITTAGTVNAGSISATGASNIGDMNVAAASAIDFNTSVIGNIGTPVADTDAATKAYVDSSLSTSGFSITDGVTTEAIIAGDTVEFEGDTNITVLVNQVSGTESNVALSLNDDVVIGNSLSVTANVSAGNVNGTRANFTNLVGTLETATQTNITSVGTLTSVTASGNITTTGNVNINARQGLYLHDNDSSHYVAIVPPATVASNVTFVLPGDAGTSDYVLSTNGAGTLSWIEQSGGGSSGASSFPNSTVTPLPSSGGNFDLSYNYAQTTQETPFESGGTDAFGVSLGEVYSMMDPAGDIPTPTDLGILA